MEKALSNNLVAQTHTWLELTRSGSPGPACSPFLQNFPYLQEEHMKPNNSAAIRAWVVKITSSS